MSTSKRDLVKYRLERAFEPYEDALLLATNKKWNSAINRLYYAAFYAVSALILLQNQTSFTHNGVKISFSERFIKTGLIEVFYGKLYSQLFSWRQKGDYDDLFDFDEETVLPYLDPVKKLIERIGNLIKETLDKTP
ncbi:MAG: HEPN domain-containing protein [Algoriphagus aquaeductus]|jgi:uncharacterized protein (UPF0332 family)|uniref:HEPN domain-containing protein n=1 Tax=Algoriphagus aquaeductus TaxID=475299 RepID=UPI00387A1ABA